MLVVAGVFDRLGLVAALARPRPRELQHLVVVELGLEVFAVAEEVEQLERGLVRRGDRGFQVGIQDMVAEVVPAGAAALDLDEIGRREDGPEQTQVQDVGTVVAGRHHTDGHAHARLACPVRGQKVARPEQAVVGEVDGELLGVRHLRRDLYREVGSVFSGKQAVGHPVEDLRQRGGMLLADREDDGLADLAAHRVA